MGHTRHSAPPVLSEDHTKKQPNRQKKSDRWETAKRQRRRRRRTPFSQRIRRGGGGGPCRLAHLSVLAPPLLRPLRSWQRLRGRGGGGRRCEDKGTRKPERMRSTCCGGKAPLRSTAAVAAKGVPRNVVRTPCQRWRVQVVWKRQIGGRGLKAQAGRQETREKQRKRDWRYRLRCSGEGKGRKGGRPSRATQPQREGKRETEGTRTHNAPLPRPPARTLS